MPIQLHYVDEVIAARQALHGGGRGAPPIAVPGQADIPAQRVGAALNRSCIVLLSALLQTYVEGVYKGEAQHTFVRLVPDAQWNTYWAQLSRWGNPSDSNIVTLFLRLGIPDVLAGLSWQRITNQRIRGNLKLLNEIRNDIAHGNAVLRFNNQPYRLTLPEVLRLRNFVQVFGERFEAHVQSFR